jgi:dTDP-glucose 4,6-dehydratase
MKILVTGGAGFIGANFILYWMDNHPEDYVVNVDKLTYAGNLENLSSISHNPHYTFVRADICDQKVMESALNSVDIVVHFAAETHVDRSITNADDFVKTNIEGTYKLLEVCRKLKIKRFHHISTDEVYGALDLQSTEKFNENTSYSPHSPYSASKAASDHLVMAYYYTYKLPVTISNCANNYGPFQFPEKLIPLAITNILEGKNVPIYGDGLYVRDWLYVTDHCRAIDAILNRGIIGQKYCIGGLTQDISNLDLIKKIIHYMGKNETLITFVGDRPGHDRRYSIDWSKMKTELSWHPEFDLDTYLHKTIEWYMNNDNWWKKIKSGEYLKYYQKQYGENA